MPTDQKQVDGYVYIDDVEEILEKVKTSLTYTVRAPFEIDTNSNKESDET